MDGSAQSSAHAPRVYVAEDSKAQRLIYASFLGNNFDVTMFGDGGSLLEKALECQPDVVISDVEMPVMDGLTLTRRLKEDARTRPVPVILLTAASSQSVSSCLDVGADDFLRKPVQADELVARTRSCARGFATYKELQSNHRELRTTHARLVEAEERTRASEARLAAILEGAHDAIVTMGSDGHIASINRAAELMFGWTRAEIGPVSFLELLSPSTKRAGLAEQLQRLATGGTTAVERQELVGHRRTGEDFPIDCSLTSVDTANGPVICAFLRDLTSSRRMEAALRQAQQLEAIGHLAAGIAHEINTPVQCIQDSVEFLRSSMEGLTPVIERYRAIAQAAEGDPRHGELIARAREAEDSADLAYVLEESAPAARLALDMSRRIADIVRATKNFAGPEGGGSAVIDLASALRNILEVSRSAYAGVADVDLRVEPMSVLCMASELNSAVRHLIVNAAHAIADTGRRGSIGVRAYQDGRDVVISVTDDGCGIAPENAGRIFEPFFTTKEVGRGVGLGLFIASSAARHHDGTLTFESAPGRGSTFHLRLPALREA
jgi:two-component system, NtrC family, sensor kinase